MSSPKKYAIKIPQLNPLIIQCRGFGLRMDDLIYSDSVQLLQFQCLSLFCIRVLFMVIALGMVPVVPSFRSMPCSFFEISLFCNCRTSWVAMGFIYLGGLNLNRKGATFFLTQNWGTLLPSTCQASHMPIISIIAYYWH